MRVPDIGVIVRADRNPSPVERASVFPEERVQHFRLTLRFKRREGNIPQFVEASAEALDRLLLFSSQGQRVLRLSAFGNFLFLPASVRGRFDPFHKSHPSFSVKNSVHGHKLLFYIIHDFFSKYNSPQLYFTFLLCYNSILSKLMGFWRADFSEKRFSV